MRGEWLEVEEVDAPRVGRGHWNHRLRSWRRRERRKERAEREREREREREKGEINPPSYFSRDGRSGSGWLHLQQLFFSILAFNDRGSS